MDRSAAKGILRHLAADRMGHWEPAARNDPAVAHNDDATFRLETAGEVFQNRRFSRTGRAHDVQQAVPFERRISAVNQFGTGKLDTSNLIFDVIQRMGSRFRQASMFLTMKRCSPGRT